MVKGRGGNHKRNGGIAQQTIELSDYESRRMSELDYTIQQLDRSRRALIDKLRQVERFRMEVYGRRAELIEMLADKYGLDPKANYSLDQNRLLVEVNDG